MPMEETAEMPENEGMESETETAVLPKSFFQGKDLEIGKTCEIKVEGIFEDEIEVSYVRHKKEDKSESKEDTMEGAMSRMDAMGGPSSPNSNEGY